MRLEDTVALVTGASQGLGYRMTAAFVAEGARVVCSARTRSTLEEAVASIEGPGSALAVPADVRSPEAVESLVDAAREAYGPVEVLVNNAGVPERRLTGGEEPPVHELPVEVWDAVVRTNLYGAFLCSRAVLPDMLDRGRGRLIHISSTMGHEARANRAAYVASKFGLEGLNGVIAAELAETGVDSMVLEPGGGVNTPGFAEHLSDSEMDGRLSPDVIEEPAVALAAGDGANGEHYVATEW